MNGGANTSAGPTKEMEADEGQNRSECNIKNCDQLDVLIHVHRLGSFTVERWAMHNALCNIITVRYESNSTMLHFARSRWKTLIQVGVDSALDEKTTSSS